LNSIKSDIRRAASCPCIIKALGADDSNTETVESDYFIVDSVVFSVLLPSTPRSLPPPLPKPNVQGKIDRWGGEAEAPTLRVPGSKVIVTICYKNKILRISH
jgi:hypothetical protein